MGTNVNLADLLPAQRFVNLGRGDAEVFPLDIAHAGTLLAKYGEALDPLFKEGGKPDFSSMAQTMPALIEDVLAMALRVEGQGDLVRRIPLSAKVEVLAATWELSVTDPKKLVAKLHELAEGARALRVEIGA